MSATIQISYLALEIPGDHQYARPAGDVSEGFWTSSVAPADYVQVWTADGGSGPWIGDARAESSVNGGTVTISDPYQVCTVGVGSMFEWDWTTHTLTLGTHAAPDAGATLTFTYYATPLFETLNEVAADDSDYLLSESTPSNDLYELKLSPIHQPVTGTVTIRMRGRVA